MVDLRNEKVFLETKFLFQRVLQVLVDFREFVESAQVLEGLVGDYSLEDQAAPLEVTLLGLAVPLEQARELEERLRRPDRVWREINPIKEALRRLEE